MTIPTTYLGALMLALLTMVCWGSWANTTKMTGKWRFELFYFDFSFGVLVCAVVAAFTFGMWGDSVNFIDNASIASRKNLGIAVFAGGVFNLANMLLVAAITVAGMAVAFPVGIGLALVIGVVWSYLLRPAGNPVLLFGGAAVVVLAIIVASMAHRAIQDARVLAPIVDRSGRSRPAPRPSATKGIALSLVSGTLMGSFFPLIQIARKDDLEVGPYVLALCFATGVFLSTPLFNMYFMSLPVQGQPVKLKRYLEGTARQHLLGVAGGVIWCVGGVANFVAAATPESVQVGPAISYALGQGATLVSTLWGLLVWKEFADASPRANTLIRGSVGLYLAGLALISIAPLFVKS